MRKNKFLAFFLSVMMISSAGAFVACNDGSSSSNNNSSNGSTETTKKDDGIITNAGFETFTSNDGKNLIGTSVNGWVRSLNSPSTGSALSSKAASGIIDTGADAWENLTGTSFDVENAVNGLTEARAKELWDTMTAKDKLDYYQVWKDANKNTKRKLEDLSFYQSFNIDAEDVPTCANPLTHDYVEGATANEDEEVNSKVLMIHNQYSSSAYKNIGTSQKYTSSSTVTVQAGTSAQFSVWVKTSDLVCSDSYGNEQPAANKGAYISITHSLGGTSLDPLEIKNIDTEKLNTTNENNGWVQFNFLLKGAAYVDSTFTIVLGLGQGGGTDRAEYVNGYAFFDDIECRTITDSLYSEIIEDATAESKTIKTITVDDVKTSRVVDVYKTDGYDFYAIDFAPSSEEKDLGILSDANEGAWEIAPTTEKRNENVYTGADSHPNNSDNDPNNDVIYYPNLSIPTTNDKPAIYTKAELNGSGNEYLQAVYDKHFKDSFLADNQKVLMLLSVNGAAYTAKAPALSEFTLEAGSYMAISFLVRTSDMSGYTGAGVTLLDGITETALTSIDTTSLTAVNVGAGVENETIEDINGGWKRCFFFVSNDTDTEKSFSLSFNFGPTTVVDTTKSSYYTGFAAFTDFQIHSFDTDKAFSAATSGTYVKVVSLQGIQEEESSDEGFDAPASVPSTALEEGFANLKNYNGVYDYSDYINANDGSNTKVNENKQAGLLNRDYLTLEVGGTKVDNADYAAILGKLGATGSTMKEKWNSVFGADTKQPLVIYNEGAQENAYGFFGESATIEANSYKTVSLRVKVSAGATANVYLIDTSTTARNKALSIKGNLVLWYDDDGNVLAMDPESESFNEKRHTAFKLQSNGLYKVNASWVDKKTISDNDFYANLSAYTEKDDEGNLLVAEGGVSYNYTSNWLNDGNDGIAFYYDKANNRYCADSKLTVPVKDFAELVENNLLKARYKATAEKTMQTTVTDTNGKWATVKFYIHTGSEAKTYRLEVWNGARDGSVKNPAGSHVIFDSYFPDEVTVDTFTALADLRKEAIKADNTMGSYFESVFSFFDSAKFLRYDGTADKNNVGNAYDETYHSSDYTEGVAYLAYKNVTKADFEIYADYALSETTVTPDPIDDDDTTDDTDTTTGETTNVWLLASSIAIAAVLLLAVVSLIVRKVLKGARRRKGYTNVIEKKSKK